MARFTDNIIPSGYHGSNCDFWKRGSLNVDFFTTTLSGCCGVLVVYDVSIDLGETSVKDRLEFYTAFHKFLTDPRNTKASHVLMSDGIRNPKTRPEPGTIHEFCTWMRWKGGDVRYNPNSGNYVQMWEHKVGR